MLRCSRLSLKTASLKTACRRFCLIGCIFACALLCLSCSPTSSPFDANTLRISVPNWIPPKFKIMRAAREFEAENPGIKVVIEQYNDLATYDWHPFANKTNGKKYDIFIGSSREFIVPFVSRGLLDNFETGFFDRQFRKEDFFPSFLELGNIDGKQYMIPFIGELMALVIRKDLFQQHHIVDPSGAPRGPQTWDELVTDARQLTTVNAKGEKIYGISIDLGTNMLVYSLYAALQAERGNIYDNKTLYIDTSSPTIQAILSNWRRLIREGLAPTYTFEDINAGRENFKAGKVAMLLVPHSRWVECAAVLGDAKVGLLPLPGATQNGSLTYIHGISLSKGSPHRALAIKFIKEKLLNRSFQTWSMMKYGKIPSLIRNYDQNLSPEWKSIFTSVRDATTLPIYKDWPKFDKTLQREVQNYLIGKQSLKVTIKKLSTQLAKIDKSTGLEL